MHPDQKLDEAVSNIKSFQEKMKEASANTKDVKDGVATPEEEQQEPAYRLYNQIAETCINVIKLPTFQQGFAEVSKSIGPETAQKLVEMMVLSMAHSAHNAIAFYDSLLKKELDNQFQNLGKAINQLGGTVNGHTGALEVFKQRLGEISKKLQLDELKIDQEPPNN